jgi:hypothetical protein
LITTLSPEDTEIVISRSKTRNIVTLSIADIDGVYSLRNMSDDARVNRRIYMTSLIEEWINQNHRTAIVWDTTKAYKDLYALYQSIKNIADREFPFITVFLDRRQKNRKESWAGYVPGKAYYTGGKVSDDHQSYTVYMINNNYDASKRTHPWKPTKLTREQREQRRLYAQALLNASK